tara:strand:+ start:799 stop:1038 length:240 start_codon:yes stop_codon:yes gene_type:complete
MIWFLVALVTYTNSPTPDLKIHGGLTFSSLTECNRYKDTYGGLLEKDLYRIFPSIDSHIIRCIDRENVEKMRQYLYGSK